MIDLDYVSRASITIIGANNVSTHIESASKENRWSCRNDQSYILELMDKKLLDVSGLVTHTFNGKDADKAYEMLMADRTQAMGVILNWED
jgi:threonine dehydrogenase-like Zn-dependent dehydrogenase